MEQYIEYIRNTIINTVAGTNDEETLKLIYGLLMNMQSSPTEYQSVS